MSTEAGTQTVTIDRGTLQIAFDVAVNSMDFGSGFLCDEDVEALRAIAVAIGVDPGVATPREFKCRYGGEHSKYGPGSSQPNMCIYCKAIAV